MCGLRWYSGLWRKGDEALRKRYTANYVLAYFDIRGNPEDVITLPAGQQLTRAEAIKRLKGSPVPAWMFVDPEGKTLLMARGSRTRVDAFMTYDLYVRVPDTLALPVPPYLRRTMNPYAR